MNYYVFTTDIDGYIIGYHDVEENDEYDYYGQMADFPDIAEGWYKWENNTLTLDTVKKALIEAEREAEELKPTWEELIQAQILHTAIATNSLIPGADWGLQPVEDLKTKGLIASEDYEQVTGEEDV